MQVVRGMASAVLTKYASPSLPSRSLRVSNSVVATKTGSIDTLKPAFNGRHLLADSCVPPVRLEGQLQGRLQTQSCRAMQTLSSAAHSPAPRLQSSAWRRDLCSSSLVPATFQAGTQQRPAHLAAPGSTLPSSPLLRTQPSKLILPPTASYASQAGPGPSSSNSSVSSSDGGANSSSGLTSTDDIPPVIITPMACRVVVIGWMGSKKRYLQKYANLWLRSGDHEVLVLRPSVAMTLMRWRGVVKAGSDIDRVARMHIENPNMPTIYHIFSTGGFIHAGTMWRWMDEVEDVVMRRDLLEEVKGIIFDSGPAHVTADIASTAIASASLGVPAEDVASGKLGLAKSLASGLQPVLSAYLNRESIKLREKEVFESWYEMAPTCPQLYLYSDSDPLVSSSEVERYMKIQESRGVEVGSHKFAGSGHCEHYRRHPHEYAFVVSQFLSRALADW